MTVFTLRRDLYGSRSLVHTAVPPLLLPAPRLLLG